MIFKGDVGLELLVPIRARRPALPLARARLAFGGRARGFHDAFTDTTVPEHAYQIGQGV